MHVPVWQCTRALRESRRITPSSPFRNPKRLFRHSNSSETSWRSLRGSTTSGTTPPHSTAACKSGPLWPLTHSCSFAKEKKKTRLLLFVFQGQPDSGEDLVTRTSLREPCQQVPIHHKGNHWDTLVRVLKLLGECSQCGHSLHVQEKNEPWPPVVSIPPQQWQCRKLRTVLSSSSCSVLPHLIPSSAFFRSLFSNSRPPPLCPQLCEKGIIRWCVNRLLLFLYSPSFLSTAVKMLSHSFLLNFCLNHSSFMFLEDRPLLVSLNTI